MTEKGLKILIVEDDPLSSRLLQEMLSSYGECDTAINGEAGVRSFQKSLEDKKSYDLICMDIMMPEVDGHQALRQIRGIERSSGLKVTEGVNIIMITALDDPPNVVKAFEDAGAIGYITKPVSKEELINEIQELGLIS
jgi:two-component system chemotaxis response regulator CheY